MTVGMKDLDIYLSPNRYTLNEDSVCLMEEQGCSTLPTCTPVNLECKLQKLGWGGGVYSTTRQRIRSPRHQLGPSQTRMHLASFLKTNHVFYLLPHL